MNFNLHGLFKFKIEGTNKRLLKYFSQDYAYFRINEEIDSELDIIVSDDEGLRTYLKEFNVEV